MGAQPNLSISLRSVPQLMLSIERHSQNFSLSVSTMTDRAAATARRTSTSIADMAHDAAWTLSVRGGIGAGEGDADDWSGE